MTQHDDQEHGRALGPARLETPPMAGFRPGMSSSSVIGRKLCSLFIVPADRKVDIEEALQALDSKLT